MNTYSQETLDEAFEDIRQMKCLCRDIFFQFSSPENDALQTKLYNLGLKFNVEFFACDSVETMRIIEKIEKRLKKLEILQEIAS